MSSTGYRKEPRRTGRLTLLAPDARGNYSSHYLGFWFVETRKCKNGFIHPSFLLARAVVGTI